MTLDQIKAYTALAAAGPDRANVTVTLHDGTVIGGTCTFAGKRVFRVNTPLAALFIPYDEVEAVE